ncbi:MAG: hypothetical protein EOP83_32585 [Verrucomicrobiaceae bacterium]|nr:MAG: hypothetical protein EOP83_32585 [Verrucomicrobiaceae bacterium]
MAWDYQTALVNLMASYDAVKQARSPEAIQAARTEFTTKVNSMRNVRCPETQALLDEMVSKVEAPQRVRIVSPSVS